MAQLAIALVLHNDTVASAITGGSRPNQVATIAQAADHRLSTDALTGIDEVLADEGSPQLGPTVPATLVAERPPW